MDNFMAVYKILSALEKAMDLPSFNAEMISPKLLGVSEERWKKYIEMMADVGYIKGVEIENYISGDMSVNIDSIKITLKGLEYLQENSAMRKAYRAALGVKQLVK